MVPQKSHGLACCSVEFCSTASKRTSAKALCFIVLELHQTICSLDEVDDLGTYELFYIVLNLIVSYYPIIYSSKESFIFWGARNTSH